MTNMHQNWPRRRWNKKRLAGKTQPGLFPSSSDKEGVSFEWHSPLTRLSETLENTENYDTRTILSTVLLKATGYKTLTSSKPRAVHGVE